MAQDSQAALVAFHRFGLGARGGASGDFVSAACDPRGFVKAELSRPNGALPKPGTNNAGVMRLVARGSTAPTAPITAPAPSRCWRAARSRVAASLQIGRA
ncbi:MAG TPA: hypothetical protein VGO49_12990 [Bradyrhizobium sp.]|jgi:hypothetical protein|nr:hypothetical protein [Bradyrhizobium sp.]